jgi:hypothetical protein
LRLVPEESPFPGRDAVVSEASATGNGQVLGCVIHGRVLKRQNIKI